MSRRKKHFMPKDRQSRAMLLPKEEGSADRDCGLCRLCEIIDAPIPRAPIRCGVVEIPREDDCSRVGLGDLNPERGVSDGCHRHKPTSYRRSRTQKLIARWLKVGGRVFMDDGSCIRKVALLEVSR